METKQIEGLMPHEQDQQDDDAIKSLMLEEERIRAQKDKVKAAKKENL